MTTFQAIVYAILRGFTEFLPVSWDAHQVLTPAVTQWSAPSGALNGALALGALLAVLVYFIHDWASMISCFLQVLLFRKKPMTLDERLPFFILIASVPVLAIAPHIRDRWFTLPDSPMAAAIGLAGFALPLWFSDSFSRKNKGMFDWNWLDALWVGLFQFATMVLGLGAMAAVLIVAFFRNYSREPAAKFAFYTLAPILCVQAVQGLHETTWHSSMPAPDLSWLSFGVAFLVCFLTSLLAIGAFIKHVARKGMMQYTAYRILLGAGTAALIWYRNR